MEKNITANQEPTTLRPISLEEAVAMAPPTASSPFIASTAAIAWGAVRSGQSVWEYLIGMTKEFEEKLQASYEAWKAENAWYPSGAKQTDCVGSAQKKTGVTGHAADSDSISNKSDQRSDRNDSTALASLEAPVGSVANNSDIVLENIESPKESSPVSIDNETVRKAKRKNASHRASADKADSSGEQANSEPPTELRSILESLPKEPDPALYDTVLEGRDREGLIVAVRVMIEKRKRIHRPRTALIAFLNWLEGLV